MRTVEHSLLLRFTIVTLRALWWLRHDASDHGGTAPHPCSAAQRSGACASDDAELLPPKHLLQLAGEVRTPAADQAAHHRELLQQQRRDVARRVEPAVACARCDGNGQ